MFPLYHIIPWESTHANFLYTQLYSKRVAFTLTGILLPCNTADVLDMISSPAGGVVDGSGCGADTGTNESTFLRVSRPGANGSPTPRANSGAGERATACCHHRQQGQSRHETHDACCDHWVFLHTVRKLLLMPLRSGASPEVSACDRMVSTVTAMGELRQPGLVCPRSHRFYRCKPYATARVGSPGGVTSAPP